MVVDNGGAMDSPSVLVGLMHRLCGAVVWEARHSCWIPSPERG